MNNSRVLVALLAFFAFSLTTVNQASGQKGEGVIKVELKEENGKWQLLRGGEPYYIKGVGGGKYMDRALAYGANSVRTWGTGEAIEALDEAHEKGLTVVFGLWVGVERQGFDYDDTKAVQAQLERFTEVVKEYKDHPAILMWGIGNENDLFYSDFKVWDAINDLAEMIHEVDPNHPTMTVTAGFDVAEAQLIMERAPHIDILGINTYGGLIGIDQWIRGSGWQKPYIIAEWGPTGHWEVEKTDWGVPIEQTSQEKADSYRERYIKGISMDTDMCIGSYVFLWGYKQETTPTWYGLFLEDGTETAVMDVLQEVWSGTSPENRAPQLASVTIDGKGRFDNIYLQPGGYFSFVSDITDPDGDALEFKYEMLPESRDIKSGGDKESKPEPVDYKTKPSTKENELIFMAPKKEGAYRMFVYIYDGKGKAATANVPFFVKNSAD